MPGNDPPLPRLVSREQARQAGLAVQYLIKAADVLVPSKAEALAARGRSAIDLAGRHPRFAGRTRVEQVADSLMLTGCTGLRRE